MNGPSVTLVFLLASGLLLWLLSLRLKDVSIIDIFWGPAIAVVVDIAAWQVPEVSERGFLALFLVNLWALRLAFHIWERHRGEDHRYGAMRKKFGAKWWWWSLFQIFLLQIILIWLIASPLAAAMAGSSALGVLDYAGFGLAVLGLGLETASDAQLARFRRDPANAGKVMDRGLWAWSRHPNYFGETMLWWGFFLIGIGGGAAWWTIVSPLIMTVLLLKVSGISMMEDGMDDRRPAYADYKRRVSAFIPWPPSAQ